MTVWSTTDDVFAVTLRKDYWILFYTELSVSQDIVITSVWKMLYDVWIYIKQTIFYVDAYMTVMFPSQFLKEVFQVAKQT
jgi:hypothetical protein